MLNIILGPKGSGKTRRMVDSLNKMALNDNLNIACLERGNRLDSYVKHQIRLIDISEYPVDSFKQLASFVAGMSAKDYDMTNLFIDSIYKVAQSDVMSEFVNFVTKIKTFSDKHNFDVTILLSADSKEDLPEELQCYC